MAVNKGLGHKIIYTLFVNGTTLFSGNHGGGMWLRPLSDMNAASTEDFSKNLPINFSLSQNYPNPFNPATTIRYNIPTAIHVTLKVYDILGNAVQTLVNREPQPGSYCVQFAAGSRRLASGVYFYRLQAESFVSTKKMIPLQ